MPDPTPVGRSALPAGMSTALSAVTEILHQRLRDVEGAKSLTDKAAATDFAGNITEANRAAVAFLRLLPDWLVGKPLFSVIADAERAALRGRVASLVNAGEDAHVRAMPYAQRGSSMFWVIRERDAG